MNERDISGQYAFEKALNNDVLDWPMDLCQSVL